MTSLKRYIGCCGAYCKTCKPFIDGACKGCKIGFDSGQRDINKAKCKIKLCCFRDSEFDTCADCPKLESCQIIGDYYYYPISHCWENHRPLDLVELFS